MGLIPDCMEEGCLLKRLSSTCAYYCEAVGTFAALIDDDYTQDLYGDIWEPLSTAESGIFMILM